MSEQELKPCYDCGKLTQKPIKDERGWKPILTLCPDCLKFNQNDRATNAPDFTISELNRGADLL